MRWSDTLVPTLREEPQEAEIVSHKLMLRAGLIRKLAGGLYTFMPLGMRALRKVEAIVREEMDRAGALEILMPALQPKEVWEQSGRYDTMGDVMFRLKDRQEREMALGPTHEEVVTDLVSREISSYRQLPKTLYQIQTKFRDEIRPRFGLMRAKEFIMKDAYSFDAGLEEANKSYEAMYNAYGRIFERCGLRTKVVEADTGAMGGKWSHEFMVLADAGEDGLVECEKCSYAANTERAERALVQKAPPFPDAGKAPEPVATPGMKTIEQVSSFFKCEPGRLIKTLIYVVDGTPVAVLVPGDRDVNEKKVLRALDAKQIALADDATIAAVTGAPVGFAGPIGLKIRICADQGLSGYKGAIAGANKADAHVVGIDLDRDAQVAMYGDIVTVRNGDSCPRCKNTLREKRGIEVGHVFKLGTKYSESFNASYLDANGAKAPLVMGCYGIGVTRTLQAVIEQSHDANGIVWPMSLAPYHVALLSLNTDNRQVQDTATQLVTQLDQQAIEVLVDDRDERPGVKFKDADLLGLPVRVVVSERSIEKNAVEIKRRTDAKADIVPISDASARIRELCKS